MEQSKRKRTQNANPAKSQDDDAGQSHEKSLTVHLTYDVLRMIFWYLKGRDLCNAAMVCRSWSEAASKEHYIRGPVCFLGKYLSTFFLLDHYEIRNLCIRPRIGILFMCYETSYDSNRKRFESSYSDFIEKLPSCCELVQLCVPGIIMNNEEIENISYPQIVFTFLSEIPNVSIKAYQVGTLISAKDYAVSEKLNKMIDDILKLNKTPTCLMLFCNQTGHEIANVMLSAIKRSHKSKICSLWGGVVDDAYMHNIHRIRTANCIAVLISGAIQTWSIVIDRKCNAKEMIEEKLKLFKDQINLKTHSVGFMFACIGRGTRMHKKQHVESTIFKTLFPNVPLVGCFGNGEFGKDTINIDDTKEETPPNKRQTRSRTKSSWYNEFSTVFMILTY